MIVLQEKWTGMFMFVNEENLINLEGNYVEVINLATYNNINLTAPDNLVIF